MGPMVGTREPKPSCPPWAIHTSHPLVPTMAPMARWWEGKGWCGGEPRCVGVPPSPPLMPPLPPHGASPTKCLAKGGRQGARGPHTKCPRVVGGHGAPPRSREPLGGQGPHQGHELPKCWDGARGAHATKGIHGGNQWCQGTPRGQGPPHVTPMEPVTPRNQCHGHPQGVRMVRTGS